MTITTLESARTCYVTRCSSCHALYQPADYAPDDWTMWMRKMTPKAKLTKDEADNVLTYILAARTATLSP